MSSYTLPLTPTGYMRSRAPATCYNLVALLASLATLINNGNALQDCEIMRNIHYAESLLSR